MATTRHKSLKTGKPQRRSAAFGLARHPGGGKERVELASGFLSFVFAFLFLWLGSEPLLAQSKLKQNQLLDQMIQIFPTSEPWEAWLKKSGALPPDFDALPSIPFLPDPLRFESGKEVRTKEEWPKRRQALLSSFQQYVLGSLPPSPRNVRA